MKDLRLTKVCKEIKFEGVWAKLEAKKLFSKTIIHKIFETNSSLHAEWRITGKV